MLFESGDLLTKVVMEIQDMVALIDKEEAADNEHKDLCDSARRNNSQKADKESKINSLNRRSWITSMLLTVRWKV